MLTEALVMPLAKAGAGVAVTTPMVLAAFAVTLLHRMHGSIGIAPPTAAMLREEDQTDCALFRHLPHLSTRLAWRSLGARMPTPIHRCTLRAPPPPSDRATAASAASAPPGATVEFFVKREDLISPLYGGNKVRTLQHQLAVIEARRARGEPRFARGGGVHVVGSGGSNQVVATAVHARGLGLPPVAAVWADSDAPDLDNTLNMLSVCSLPLASASTCGALQYWAEMTRHIRITYLPSQRHVTARRDPLLVEVGRAAADGAPAAARRVRLPPRRRGGARRGGARRGGARRGGTRRGGARRGGA